MAYALNIKKGTTIHNESIGVLEAGIAIPIDDDVVHLARGLRGVIVFEKVVGIDEAKAYKNFYGRELKESSNEELKQDLIYQDFVRKYKDLKIASTKYKEYMAKKENK